MAGLFVSRKATPGATPGPVARFQLRCHAGSPSEIVHGARIQILSPTTKLWGAESLRVRLVLPSGGLMEVGPMIRPILVPASLTTSSPTKFHFPLPQENVTSSTSTAVIVRSREVWKFAELSCGV